MATVVDIESARRDVAADVLSKNSGPPFDQLLWHSISLLHSMGME